MILKSHIPKLLICLILLFAKMATAQTVLSERPDTMLAEVSTYAKAVKLPNIQQISLRAPERMKIDGKATEWENRFYAYNRNTCIYYTMANDDKNLYLTIKANDPGIINKIIGGGISFTINTSGKKYFKDGMNIAYPVLQHDRIMINFAAIPKLIPGSDISLKQVDSFVNINNNRLIDKSKLIRVSGIKDVDTLISVYNVDGIKAAELFDNKMIYTYELSVDLKKLGLNTIKPSKFAYNIMLPGLGGELFGSPLTISGTAGNMLTMGTYKPPKFPVHVVNNPTGQLILVSTDFWGEYTLAK